MTTRAQLETRSIEMASRALEAHDRHVIECRDRYLAVERALAGITQSVADARKEREESAHRLQLLLWRTATATITLLLGVIGWLLTHPYTPTWHP